MKLKFATWNIGCGAGGYYGQPIADIAKWIRENDLDVCVLQEVDRYAARSSFIDFPAFLEIETRMSSYYKPSFTLPPERDGKPAREYGNCILTRHRILEAHHISLFPPHIPDDAERWEKEPRAGLVAKLDCGGACLWVATAHLAYSPEFRPSATRRQQVELLVGGLRAVVPDGDALVFGGDLNTSPDGDDIEALRKYLKICTSAIGPTWPLGGTMGAGRAPFVTIDHIFTRGAELNSVEKFDETALSDHSAVIAEFTYTPS